MEGQEILTAVHKLIESGAFENIDKPGAQTAIIYSLLILLAGMVLKYIVLNGTIKRFFDLEETKVKYLASLNEKVVDLQKIVTEEHQKLTDVLRLLNAKRHSDKIDGR